MRGAPDGNSRKLVEIARLACMARYNSGLTGLWFMLPDRGLPGVRLPGDPPVIAGHRAVLPDAYGRGREGRDLARFGE